MCDDQPTSLMMSQPLGSSSVLIIIMSMDHEPAKRLKIHAFQPAELETSTRASNAKCIPTNSISDSTKLQPARSDPIRSDPIQLDSKPKAGSIYNFLSFLSGKPRNLRSKFTQASFELAKTRSLVRLASASRPQQASTKHSMPLILCFECL